MTSTAATAGPAGQVDTRLRVEHWRVRIYSIGFIVSYLLYLGSGGFEHWPVVAAAVLVTTGFGAWKIHHRWLRGGLVAGTIHALLFPFLVEAVSAGEPLVALVARFPVWPQLLVTLMASRALASESHLAFARFWLRPLDRTGPVEMQSAAAPVALACFLILLFYLVIPHLFAPGSGQVQSVVVSAVLGRTIVHSAIVFLFLVVMASIVDAASLHIADRRVIAGFSRTIEAERGNGRRVDLSAILTRQLAPAAHTRAVRLLNAAIDGAGAEVAGPSRLTALSFDRFQWASRQFVRSLLPLLPLLGFLGTVIGLASAISDLPHDLNASSGHNIDISASLAGLAVKFETTLLGLIASIICSLALGLLEKRETELAAMCMLIVDKTREAR
ncbi:hypothetical protein XH83_13255 [Bradyrhizobium sp. CCBAU 53351]|uniref:MotA/TolQ/ExbB proton channel family protein n=1 Tax=Bradyrhizobium sp. CCBAU 53351 TaxID=1325114 RepID=UPI001886B08E|nr:MotA/TolQ/ExbB proton channel family protein [Bradyrhizobium sp. CCBAU 53351]QOZ76329.1 hypothetical protein XH83_13255 [Bradyrhizobium sp. CCBAU 53351]